MKKNISIRKLLSLVFACMISIVSILPLVSCKKEPSHEHNLFKVEAKAATCVKAGNVEYYRCDGCDDLFSDAEGKKIIEDIVIKALGHDFEDHTAKDASCTEMGWEAYQTCKREGCSYTNQVELPAKGHNFTSHVFVAPTKTEYGLGEQIDLTGMNFKATCSVCGEIDVTKDVKVSHYSATAPDANGKLTITVTYLDITETFSVNVNSERDEVLSCWVGWDTPEDNKHSSSFFLADPTLYSVGESYAYSFKVGAKMRFYFYSDKASNARLSCRAATGMGSYQANQAFNINVYKPTSEGQDLSTLTPEKLSISDDVRFGVSTDENQNAWYAFEIETYLGDITLQKGWNVIELEVAATKSWDFNFKSMIIDYTK